MKNRLIQSSVKLDFITNNTNEIICLSAICLNEKVLLCINCSTITKTGWKIHTTYLKNGKKLS